MLLNSSFLTFIFLFFWRLLIHLKKRREAASWKELKFLFHSYLFAPNNNWVFQTWNGIRQEKELLEQVTGNWQNKQLVYQGGIFLWNIFQAMEELLLS